MRLCALLCLLTPVLALCAAEPRPAVDTIDTSQVHIRGLILPVVWLEADEDTEIDGSTSNGFEQELDAGWGAGALLQVGGYQRIGLAYQFSRHNDEGPADKSVTAHAVYLEGAVMQPIVEAVSGGFRMDLELAVGVGGAWFDAPAEADLDGGGALAGRAMLEAAVADRVSVGAGMNAFLWGYPGETIGYGFGLILSGGVSF